MKKNIFSEIIIGRMYRLLIRSARIKDRSGGRESQVFAV